MSATTKWQSKQVLQRIEGSRFQDRNRRARLNVRVGMSKSHPWAFQLSAEEVDEAEAAALRGEPPLPLVPLDNGLLILEDPFRSRLRAQRWQTASTAEERSRYVPAGDSGSGPAAGARPRITATVPPAALPVAPGSG